jgi:hypothetical protein
MAGILEYIGCPGILFSVICQCVLLLRAQNFEMGSERILIFK